MHASVVVNFGAGITLKFKQISFSEGNTSKRSGQTLRKHAFAIYYDFSRL